MYGILFQHYSCLLSGIQIMDNLFKWFVGADIGQISIQAKLLFVDYSICEAKVQFYRKEGNSVFVFPAKPLIQGVTVVLECDGAWIIFTDFSYSRYLAIQL